MELVLFVIFGGILLVQVLGDKAGAYVAKTEFNNEEKKRKHS